MLDLTFGEQVKIILSRKGMTIKELAETIEERTGKKMSRQNLTQRLGRDNFQEQDMRMIAGILGCPFHLNILDDNIPTEQNSENTITQKNTQTKDNRIEIEAVREPDQVNSELERDITIGELVDIHEKLDGIDEAFEEQVLEEAAEEFAVQQEEEIEEVTQAVQEEEHTEETAADNTPVEELLEEMAAIEREAEERNREKENYKEKKVHGWKAYLQRRKKKDAEERIEETAVNNTVDTEEQDAQDIREEDSDKPAMWAEEIVLQEAALQAQSAEYETNEDEPEGETIYLEEDDLGEEGKAEPEDYEDEPPVGDINPYTGREYESNSVRMHPHRIGYVQVYDRGGHQWTDMTEWAFLGYQERKKALLGKDYEPPIYLD